VPNSPAETAPGPILLAAATSAERQTIDGILPNTVCLQTGVGVPEPEKLLERVRALNPTGLVSTGTAGALAPDLKPGTILLPRRILSPGGRFIDVSPHWHTSVRNALSETVDPHTEDLWCADRVIRSPEQKAALHRESGAVAVEMESMALFHIAKSLGLPFIVVRVIMDAAEDEIPVAALAAVSASGDLDLGALAGRLWRHPLELGALISLSRSYRKASQGLRQALLAGGSALTQPV
jgi:adenosylhomocysteine nucleosidase